MDWKNAEQFPDFTAGEAVARAMIRDPERLEAVDDDGCRLLARAVVMQAITDYFRVLRRDAARPGRDPGRRQGELEDFFRSEYFFRLSRINGNMLMRRIRKAVVG